MYDRQQTKPVWSDIKYWESLAERTEVLLNYHYVVITCVIDNKQSPFGVTLSTA